MKELFFVLLLASASGFSQDLKDAASEKSTLLEGRLRDAKPAAASKLSDGTEISIWTLPEKKTEGQPVKQIVKATANFSESTANEGMRTVKVHLDYENGMLAKVSFAETRIVQDPAPSVTSKSKDFVFSEGTQTSPTPGTAPEMEKFIREKAAEIEKLYQNVDQK